MIFSTRTIFSRKGESIYRCRKTFPVGSLLNFPFLSPDLCTRFPRLESQDIVSLTRLMFLASLHSSTCELPSLLKSLRYTCTLFNEVTDTWTDMRTYLKTKFSDFLKACGASYAAIEGRTGEQLLPSKLGTQIKIQKRKLGGFPTKKFWRNFK